MISHIKLKCPCRKKEELIIEHDSIKCSNIYCSHSKSSMAFQYINSKPILISNYECETICNPKITSSAVIRRKPWQKRISSSLQVDEGKSHLNCQKFVSQLKDIENAKVLIIGSGDKGFGTDTLWNSKHILKVGIDIYDSPTVDILCDAHNLPIQDQTFDGVWIQAVLEHVVDPQSVVAEIRRVLKPGGFVYSELPFMQQVHEGPYDFCRFTLGGHRFLFQKYIELGSGRLGGPVDDMAWTIKYFFTAMTSYKFIGKFFELIFRLIFLPITPFINRRNKESYTGSYFFGQKSDNFKIRHKDLIKYYNKEND
tara:strand:- start:263 stop:1195 length:933 start_codon:yes stop_codon:yes gene_type:complete